MPLLNIVVGGLVLSTGQAICVGLVLAFLLYTYSLHMGYNSSNPIVWSWVPHLRSALLFGSDPNTFLAKCKASYGSIFTLNLGGRHITFITDPSCYPHITKARDGLSFAEVAVGVSKAVLNEPVESADDKELDAGRHAQYTKYLTGAPLDDITQRFGDYLQEWFHIHFEREKNTLSNSSSSSFECGLLDLATRAIFSSSTRALFGEILVDDSSQPEALGQPEFSDDFFAPKTLLSTFQKFDHIFPLLYGGLPNFLLKEGIHARTQLIETMKTLKKDHCEFMSVRKDLMLDHPPTPRPKTDPDSFGSSQLGFLWALQGNTIPATFWTLFFLIQNPEAMERVKKEIRTVLDEANKDRTSSSNRSDSWRIDINRENLKKFTLLDCAISEALRIATGSMMMRRATKDMVLDLPTGPLSIKKGMNLAIYPYLTHHDSSIFPNPEEFNLERWMEKSIEIGTITDVKGNKIPNAFMPFGSGISMCPGRHFARAEIKMFCVTFLHLFDIQSEGTSLKAPGFLLSRSGLGIFPPEKDVNIKYAPRTM